MNINTNLTNQIYNSSMDRDLNNFREKADNNQISEGYRSNSNTENGNQNKEDEKLKLLASEFTSILMKQMFKSMRNTIPENNLIDGGYSEEVFTDMLDDEISKTGSRQNEFNSLARMLYQQLKNNE
ncbi:MAG: rod-binding protein [Halanaerobiales bacterium]